jgi:methionine sulfoxide reductase heme-binding subunit
MNATALHPARLLRDRYRTCWWTLLGLLALPAVSLMHGAWSGTLGANPLERIERDTGRWAIVCLTLSLAVTPGRKFLARTMTLVRAPLGKRLSDWNPLVRMRRMIGLMAFAYAALHVGAYLELDVGWDWLELLASLREKPYVLAGACAFVMLIPLAATSTDRAIRRLGRHWKRLHRLSYGAAIAAALHFLWMSKPGVLTAYPYVGAIAVLLGYRVLVALQPGFDPRRDGGDEVPERPRVAESPSMPSAAADHPESPETTLNPKEYSA